MRLKKIARKMLLVAMLFVTCPTILASGAAHASGGGAEAGPAVHGLNWFDFSNHEAAPLIALLVNFACLLALLYIILRKPLSARFKNRKMDLESAIQEAEEMKAKAEKALGEARAKSEALDVEMEKLRTEIIEAGKAESIHIVEDAGRQSKRMRDDAKIMVEQEVTRLAQAIREDVVTEMVKMAEVLVKEKINQGDHQRLSKEYLDGMSPRSMPAGKPTE